MTSEQMARVLIKKRKHQFRVGGNREEDDLYLDPFLLALQPGAIRAWGLARPTPAARQDFLVKWPFMGTEAVSTMITIS